MVRRFLFGSLAGVGLGLVLVTNACTTRQTSPIQGQSSPTLSPSVPATPLEATTSKIANQLAQKQRTDAKGIAQVWVSPGCFQRGSDPTSDVQARPNEQPKHEICITRGFWLDTYEVTNAAYQEFIDDAGYTRRELWSEDGWQWKGDRTGPENIEGFTDPQQPRVGISWYEADAYARWRSGRLPTEAEWEYAARGPESLIYPWGNEYEIGRANVNESQIGGQSRGQTLPVGSFDNGKSWVGAYDMAGNVWEWTADWYDPNYYQQGVKNDPPGPKSGEIRVARGSSWYLDPVNARSTTRRDRPFVLNTVSGIRVATPAQE